MNKMLVANWKMNLNAHDVQLYCEKLDTLTINANLEVILAPSYLHIPYVSEKIESFPSIKLAAQDCSAFSSGAYTGDISPDLLKDYGCKYVIIGHSERRQNYEERVELLASKVDCAFSAGLTPIFCIGEDLETRREKEVLPRLRQQIRDIGLNRLINTRAVIAYEPVWSIGTGLIPSIEQIEEVVSFLGELLPGQQIIYGGSVNMDNCRPIQQVRNLDGLLIGKVSTDPISLAKIITSISI